MITNESSSLSEPIVDPLSGFPGPSFPQQPVVINPDNPPWGVLKALLTWLMSIGCLVFVPLLVVVPYIIYLATTSGMPQAETLATDKTIQFLSILGVVPAHLLTFAVGWVVVTNWGRYPFWQMLGFTWPASFGPWKSTGLAVVLLAVGGGITALYGGSKTQLDQLIESSYQARLVTAFLAAATGPFVEELVYRGVLYPALQRVMGVGLAIAIVSIMFAGVHVIQYYNNLAVIGVILLLSITLTVVRARTGRLLPSFMIHLVFNGIQSIFLIVQPFFEKADTVLPNKTPACQFIINTILHFI